MTEPDVIACIVSHAQRELLARCLPGLERDGVPVALLENVPDGSAAAAARHGARAGRNPVPRTFAQNQNALIAATRSRYVLVLNPDTELAPGAVAELLAHADAHPAAGVVGPCLLETDGTVQRSRRTFPTVGGTLVRRSPLRLALGNVEAVQPGHYLSDVPSRPVTCDWMLGACLLLRRRMLDEIGCFDERFPMYGEDIELQYRAMRAGWERWYVPASRVVHDYQRVIDHRLVTPRTLWHLRGMVRYVRQHPETLMSLR